MVTTLARPAARTRPRASQAESLEKSSVASLARPGQVEVFERRDEPNVPARRPAPQPDLTAWRPASARSTTLAASKTPPGFALEKAFTVLGLTVGSLVAILFGLDLATAFPFHRATLVGDVGFLVSSALLVYLSIDVVRDQRRAGLW